MKNSIAITAYVKNEYNKFLKKYLVDNNLPEGDVDTISPEDREELDREFEGMLIEDALNEKPLIDPKIIAEYYKRAVPGLKVFDKVDPEREDLRRDAAISYMNAQLRIIGYRKGCINNVDNREDQRIVRLFNDEDMKKFRDCLRRMDKKTYDKNKSEKEIDLEVAKATREKNLLVFQNFQKVIDTYSQTLTKEMSDKELIEKYPEIVEATKIIIEGDKYIGNIKALGIKEVPPHVIEEYEARKNDLMFPVTMLEKRMAMLSDPYYPYMNLESFFDADLTRLMKFDGEDPENNSIMKDNKIAEIRDIGGTHPTEITKEEIADVDPTCEIGILASENILGLIEDASFVHQMAVDEAIAQALSMKGSEFKANMLYCDKNGKTYEPADDTPYNIFEKTNGEFYIISKSGDMDPIPVLLDKTAEGYKPLVGITTINKTKTLLPEKPTISTMALLYNFFYRPFHDGEDTETVKQYNAAKAAYDEKKAFVDRKRIITKRGIPNAVKKASAPTAERYAQIKAKQDRYNQNANSIMKARNLIPEGNDEYLDNALGALLANKALGSQTRNKFRSTMFSVLNVYGKEFDDAKEISDFVKSDRFREFAWNLRRNNSKLADKFRNGNENEAEAALNEIMILFSDEFGIKNAMAKPVSQEFLKYKEDREAALNPANEIAPEKQLEAKLLQERDCESYWDIIMNIYGPERNPDIDWIREISGKDIMDMGDWFELRQDVVNLDKCKLDDNDEPIDARTFAALAMMLSLRKPEFFSSDNLKETKGTLDTPAFEDIVKNGEPGKHTGLAIREIIQPTREKLVRLFENADKLQIDETGTGKEGLAYEIADALKLYVDHMSKHKWDDRSDPILAMVCEKVLEFAENHGLMKDIKNRLDLIDEKAEADEKIKEAEEIAAAAMKGKAIDNIKNANASKTYGTLEKARIINAIGRITNDALNAEADLTLEKNGVKQLSDEERLACIDKIMLLKAVQASTESTRGEPELPDYIKDINRGRYEDIDDFNERKKQTEAEYNAIAKKVNNDEICISPISFGPFKENLLGDRMFAKNLSIHMLAYSERLRLAKAGSEEILKTIRCSQKDDKLIEKWKTQVGEGPTNIKKIEEIRGRVNTFRNYVEEMRHDEKYNKNIEVLDKVLKSSDLISQRNLGKLDKDFLKAYAEGVVEKNMECSEITVQTFFETRKNAFQELKQKKEAHQRAENAPQNAKLVEQVMNEDIGPLIPPH